LESLFERSTNPPVNPHWDATECADLVMALKAPFRGRKPLTPPDEYVRRLTFCLKKDNATHAALNEGRIPADAIVNGNQKSFELFGLRTAKTAKIWQALEKSWHRKISPSADGTTCSDPVALWVESVAQKMLQAINGEDFDDGLPLFFNQFAEKRAQAVFRPSLAKLISYPDVYEFDIVFVDVPSELAAMSEGPLTTVGGLLRLAHMFRFGWVEAAAKEVINRPPAELADVARSVERRLRSITAESFNQGIRTEQAVLVAFEEGSALQTEIQQAIKQWQETVYPEIDKSFKDKDTKRILAALKKASAINWQFHRACAKRYWEIVEKHYGADSGPLDPV
jgi:hypothetical protein